MWGLRRWCWRGSRRTWVRYRPGGASRRGVRCSRRRAARASPQRALRRSGCLAGEPVVGGPSGGGRTPADRALGLARHARNAGTRHSRCTCLASSMPTPIPRMPHRPKPTTSRPLPWPRNSVCAPSRPTATAASARCMPHRPARAGPCRIICRHRALSRHGDAVLAPPGGSHTGTGAMRHSKGGSNAVRTARFQSATWRQRGLP